MKQVIKKIIFYDKLYPIIKSSFFYQYWKKGNALIAQAINNNPAKDFFIIGVTGTNGKTTTVNLLHKMLNEQLAKTISISTESIRIGHQVFHNDKKMTSLDVFDLQSTLSQAKAQGCKIAVLEASSQGIDQNRFEGIRFDYGILTNITRDHLDYHNTMEEYTRSKQQLFKAILKNGKSNKYGSFPMDDRAGKDWYENMAFDKRISYSVTMNSTLKANNIRPSLTGTDFEISYLGKIFEVHSPLLGEHNVYNFLAALSVGINIGLDIEKCIKSLETMPTISGRLEKISHKEVDYFVDFAHTPDGLEKTLSYLSEMKMSSTTPGKNRKLITVFGAPGNRDKDKRPEMGNIAWKYSDVIIATDDDADTENRFKILEGLTSQITPENNPEKEFVVIPERKFAIKFAVELAQAGDIVIFAGKGHETVQITNEGKRPWSDKKVVEYYLSKKK
ncbi:MAG: UDP-N-acetylmuramoyl-L-alanyl-D-glutamate--2,6-diaminopimelate ligase [candidate division SR1 bacterium]|nr:MAG: UDP-N-acetylmuramoyl-L-alanyl-D-glutamate--2,6-diaminopimelate ligase [candidate division SR1 bacterium]